MKDKDLDKDTIVAYHGYLQQKIHEQLNGLDLGPGHLPCRLGQGFVLFGFLSFLTGILLIALRHRHVYLVDWNDQFLGPFFIILWLVCMGAATYLIVLAKRRTNAYRRELYFRPLGDYGIATVHKSHIVKDEELKHELKSGTTPHKKVMPRSEAYSNYASQPPPRRGHENRGYDYGGDHRRPPDDRRRPPQDDSGHLRPPDDRDRRRPPPGDRRRPPPDDRDRRRPPPDDHRRPPEDRDRRGPPPDDRKRPPDDRDRRMPPDRRDDRDRRGPPDDRRRPPPDDRDRRRPPPDDRDRRGPPPDDRRRPPPDDKRRPPPDDRRGPPPDRRPPPPQNESTAPGPESQGPPRGFRLPPLAGEGRGQPRGRPNLGGPDARDPPAMVLDPSFGQSADSESEL